MTPDPLAGLRGWHLPEPVSWWPPAPGWWLVAGVALLVIVLAGRGWLGWRRKGRLARAARRELDAIGRRFASDGDQRRYVAALSALLKRLALTRYPRERVAGLSGTDWLEFLDATGGAGGFTTGAGRVLVEAAYRPAAEVALDPDQLRALILAWVQAKPR